jgi:hypothetical protein
VAEQNPAAEVAKHRKGMTTALLAILLVIVAIVGAAYALGVGPFGAWDTEPADTAQSPTKPSTEDTESVVTTVAPAVKLPPTDAQEVMYWEQIASAEQISDLVADKFAEFELSQIAENTATADIRVKATYREGGELNGWMLLRKYNDAWFFAMITRDGNPTTTPVSGAADMAVAKAIAEGNAANQEIPAAILEGSFTKIVVNRVTAGSGTALIDVTFSGGTAEDAKGQISCISKKIGGETRWFITAFAKS